MVTPRWEYRASDNIGLSTSATIGRAPGPNDIRHPVFTFWPAFGVHGYFPTGWGGFVVTKELTSTFVLTRGSLSVAYDCVLPLREPAKLHFFPEVRLDYMLGLSDSPSGFMALSPGLSVLVEL